MSDGPFGRRGEAPPPPEAPEEPRYRPGPPRPPAGITSNATWIAAAVIGLVLIYVTINTLRTDSNGSRGVPAGQRVPPFAAPLALANARCKGGEECDANVQTHARNGVPKACDVHGANVMNSCDLTRKPLVLAFLVAPSQKCIDQIDVLDRLRVRFPDVQFAAVAIRGDHGDLNAIVRRHGWKLPVAYDHDGAIANAFAVAICPTITFARRGGEVANTTLGTASEAEIAADIRRIRSIHPRGGP
jgi:hypothetical protein